MPDIWDEVQNDLQQDVDRKVAKMELKRLLRQAWVAFLYVGLPCMVVGIAIGWGLS